MQLYRHSKRIFYTSYEEERDRPALGYIKGERFCLAVDAGHSSDHLHEFYALLRKNDLPLPSLTILTHWHWDHSFALHAINGLSLASRKTDACLRDFIVKRSPASDQTFLDLDPCIRKEYPEGKPLIVVPADIIYENHLQIDAGDLQIQVFESVSPHCDDATLIYVPQEKFVFLGDSTSGPFPTYIPDPEKLKEMLPVLENIDADHFLHAHVPLFKKADLIDQLKNSL